MAEGGWQGNITVILIVIAVVICFAWIPVVAIISLFHNGRARIRKFFEKLGWMRPAPDEEKRIARQQKAPWVQKPPPAYPNPSARALERTASTRTHHSVASWDPTRKWETASSILNDPPAAAKPSLGRSGSGRSNFSRPMPSRASSVHSVASSVRSTASNHQSSGQSRGRRLSAPAAPDLPPLIFQINDAYYDTTPLPDRPPSIGPSNVKLSASRSQSRASRSHSPASAVSGSQGRRGTSFDIARQQPGEASDNLHLKLELPPSVTTPALGRASLGAPFERPAWLDEAHPPHAM
ncbi:hypothetical protein QBC34DRAFT_156166 [Podospora aff. communis PSN243]|uniref:Uncharacterized protein n=1 Tax=Podospora aff. communis PSN243 TaxID=3040156 RepID=A0AAV9H181_9PEZI|nr:hypothetical protein QBC34DRAFT_156166 [Podospora aff. communis PSN243]